MSGSKWATKYGYARVSTDDQNAALQLAAGKRGIRTLRFAIHPASHGSKTPTPRPAKSLTLRVTTLRPRSIAVAAIMPSATPSGRLLTLSV
jgi:hypothetical protein